jgi:hypothetical protein
LSGDRNRHNLRHSVAKEMSGFTCTDCGAETKVCCDVTTGAQACQDGQICGTDNMCPAAIPSGWAGDPCGTGATKCQGELTCDPTSKNCECNQDAKWTSCSADNTKVCAPASTPPGPPAPPSGKYTGNCQAGQGTKCATGQFYCYAGGDKGECNPTKSYFQDDANCTSFCTAVK